MALLRFIPIERTDFHAEVQDKLETIVSPNPLLTVQTSSTPSVASSSSSSSNRPKQHYEHNSLFQDYFNTDVQQFDEMENYLNVVIPPVCLRVI